DLSLPDPQQRKLGARSQDGTRPGCRAHLSQGFVLHASDRDRGERERPLRGRRRAPAAHPGRLITTMTRPNRTGVLTMTIRSNLLVLLASAAIFASVAVRAESSVVSIEHGFEASSGTLLMPSSTSGSVTLTCATCNAKSWRLTNQTKFLIGERAVTLQEFT